MRFFVLRRHRDISGVSGTGTVAEGVEWSDGTVALRWLSTHPTTESLESIEDVELIHGHDGATEIRFEPYWRSG